MRSAARIKAILGVLTIATLSLVPRAAMAADAAPAKRPLNVLWIVTDDLRCSLGTYGNSDVRSPNIDRLAERGMRFDRAYCQYPMCNPSRSSFLSGRRPDTLGILDNQLPLRQKVPDVVTLPQYFRNQGYASTGFGKIFHAGIDEKGKPKQFQDPKSFERFDEFAPTELGRKGEGRNMTGGALAWCRWMAAEGTDEDQPDGQTAAAAVKVLEAKHDKPFFLSVGFHKPHDPFIAPKQYFDLYPLASIRLNRDPADATPDLPIALPPEKAFTKFTDKERREFQRSYYAGTSFTDAQIGKLFDAMDRNKLWDNTIVVFMGDHGYHLGEHGWWNKVTVFELSSRAPMIVWAPGAAGMGKGTAGIVEFLDIYPTILDLCGMPGPAGLEGRSFRPLLEDPSRPGKLAAFTQVTRGKVMGRSVRTDRFRFTEWDDGKAGVELYDHANDEIEYHNLAADPKHIEDVRTMRELLRGGPKHAAVLDEARGSTK